MIAACFVTLLAETGGVARRVVADRAALALGQHIARRGGLVAHLPDLGPTARRLEREGLVEQADQELVAQVGAAEAERDSDEASPVARRAADDVEPRGADEAGLQTLGVGRVELDELHAALDVP